MYGEPPNSLAPVMPPTEFTQSIQNPTASPTSALPRHFLEKCACLSDIQRFLHSPIAAKKSGHLEPTPPWRGSKRTVEMNKIFQSVYKSSAPECASTWPRVGSPALLPGESWRISHWPTVRGDHLMERATTHQSRLGAT